MKVLFAVNNDKISSAIVKRYKEEYNEEIEFKNVYYFNGLISEIKKDKSYDRIVISEELEPFSTNNYDEIDNFIFDKLDSIGDEADEIDIILICTDRRDKRDPMLSKLFSIGVYNVLIGNDRSIEQLCKLIRDPRTKKEAKQYINFDARYAGEDDDEKENKVSELELKNILAHYKKLGSDYDKYAKSFDNIAGQYNTKQLKIIINVLPTTVKEVLEQKSDKYKEVVAFIEKLDMLEAQAQAEEEEKSKTKPKTKRTKKEKNIEGDNAEKKSTKRRTTTTTAKTAKVDAPPLDKPIIIPGVSNKTTKLKIEKTAETSLQEEKIIEVVDPQIETTQAKKTTPRQFEVEIEEQVKKEENEYKPVEEKKLEVVEDNTYEEIRPMTNTFVPSDEYSKVVSLVGSSKTGTTFLTNLIAQYFSLKGINTAILDMTKNKNTYYIYTNNQEELREITYDCLNKLSAGIAKGLKVSNTLSVFTTLPNDDRRSYDISNMINTLSKNYSIILIDTDYSSPIDCFAISQEIYAIQDMDILNIQDLTCFIRELKTRNISLDKLRIILNKFVKIKFLRDKHMKSALSDKTIISAISVYNDPKMKVTDELFDPEKIESYVIPFYLSAYKKSIDNLASCIIELREYEAAFIKDIRKVANMIYPVLNKSKKTIKNVKSDAKLSKKTEDILDMMKQRK